MFLANVFSTTEKVCIVFFCHFLYYCLSMYRDHFEDLVDVLVFYVLYSVYFYCFLY